MLKSIGMKNFQSHKETVLELSNGLNAIFGMTNSGKSAIIRASRWLAMNLPKSTRFFRTGMKDCSVFWELDNCTIFRIREPDFNGYEINGSVITSFEAAGREVPREVTDALRMEAPNWHFQADGHFLLSETSGDAARILNRIVRLDEIDLSLSNLNGWNRATLGEITDCERAITDAKQNVECWDFLDEMQRGLEQLERAEKDVTAKGVQLDRLRLNIHALMDLNIAVSNAEIFVSAGRRVGVLERRRDEWEERHIVLSALSTTVSTLQRLASSRATLARIATRGGCLERLEVRRAALATKQASFRSLCDLTNTLKSLKDAVAWQEKEVAGLQAQWRAIAPATCPYCGAAMPVHDGKDGQNTRHDCPPPTPARARRGNASRSNRTQ